MKAKMKTKEMREIVEKVLTNEIIEKFNEKFPVGATVRWRALAADKMPYREYTVRYAAENHCGIAVAWFAEKSGFVSVEPDFVDYGEK